MITFMWKFRRRELEEFFKVIPELQKPVPPSDRAKKVSTEPSYSKTKKTVVVASNPPPSQVVINGGGSSLPTSGGSDKKALNSLTRQRANSQLYSIMENPNTGAGNIKKFQVTNNRTGNSVDLSAILLSIVFTRTFSQTILLRAIVVETGNQDQGAQDSTIDGLPIRGGEKVVIEVEDATQQPITLRNPLRVNKIGKATPGTRQDVYVLETATDEYHLNEADEGNETISRKDLR